MLDLQQRQQAAKMLGGREVRDFTVSGFELREFGGALNLSGLASVTESAYDMGFYQETIKRGAFSKTLSEMPDVQLLINHRDLPIARTGRNMTLSEDDQGLRVEARLNPDLPKVQELALTARDGLVDQMSFAFRVTRQSWDDDYENREILEVNIDRGDVSVVNQGANPATSFSMRDAQEMLSAMNRDEFVAFMRSIHPEEGEATDVPIRSVEVYRARALARRAHAHL